MGKPPNQRLETVAAYHGAAQPQERWAAALAPGDRSCHLR